MSNEEPDEKVGGWMALWVVIGACLLLGVGFVIGVCLLLGVGFVIRVLHWF